MADAEPADPVLPPADGSASTGAGAGRSGSATDAAAAGEGRLLQAELPPGSNRLRPRDRDRLGDWFHGTDYTTGLGVVAGSALIAVARWPARFIERAMQTSQPRHPKAR